MSVTTHTHTHLLTHSQHTTDAETTCRLQCETRKTPPTLIHHTNRSERGPSYVSGDAGAKLLGEALALGGQYALLDHTHDVIEENVVATG